MKRETVAAAIARNASPEEIRRLTDKLNAKPVTSDFFVTVNGERGRIWQNAVGTRTFPVTNKNPEPASVLGNVVMAYFLDLRRVDARLRDKIEHFLSERFRQPLDLVRCQIQEAGVPILARNVTTPEGWQYGDTDD